MRIFINRLRWLSAGIYLGMALFAWLAQDDNKKIKKMVDKWPQPFDSGIDRPPSFTEYKHNHNKEA